MRANNITRIVSGLAIALVLVSSLTTQTWAQDDEPDPNIPMNEYGTPDMDQIDLTMKGEYLEPIVLIEDVPVVGDVGFNLAYDVYSDNYGNTWVVPDPVTVLFTAIFPEHLPDGLANANPSWHYESVLFAWVEMAGGLEAMGIPEPNWMEISTDQDLAAYIGDIIELQGDHWQFFLAMKDVLAENDSLPLWQLAWVYDDDPFDPTDDPTPVPDATGTPPPTATPRPTNTPYPTRTPEPTPINCPPPRVEQAPPSALTTEVWPPHPVVTGQGGQGFDITLTVISYPAIYRWWTQEWQMECTWHEDPLDPGQPDTSVCGCVPGGGDGCWPGWGLEKGEQRCVEHREIYPDIIDMAALRGSATLHETSIEWIETDLAGKYPGAEVYKAHHSVGSHGAPVVLSDGRCVLIADVLHFPFQDPGYYDVAWTGRTSGTPYTPPRSFSDTYPSYLARQGQEPEALAVYLMDTSLIR